MNTTTPRTLGEALDELARAGMNACAQTMHAGSDYHLQARQLAKDYQDHASSARITRTDALLVKVTAELMQTETALRMLALIEQTPNVLPTHSPRALVLAAFRRVQGGN